MDDNRADDAPEHVHDQHQRSGLGDAVNTRQPFGFVGWLLLITLFAFLLIGSVNNSFKRPDGKIVPTYTREFAYHVGLRKLTFESREADPLDSILKDLEANKTANNEAAVMWTLYRDLAGKPVSESDIQSLKNSKEEADRAIYGVFGAEKLSPAQADRLIEALPRTDLGSYAKKRALEKSGRSADWSSFSRRSQGAIVGLGFAVVAALTGVLLFVGYLAGRSQGLYRPVGHPALPMSQFESDAYAMRTVALMLLIAFVPELVYIATGGMPGSTTLAAIACVAAALFLGRFRIWGVRVDRYTLGNSVKGWRTLIQGGLIYLMGLPFIGAMMVLGTVAFRGFPDPEHPATTAIPSATPIQMVGIFAMACVQAPIVEELAFRGSLLPALTRVLRYPWVAVILVNLVFAAIHPTGVPSWPALASIGIVASFAVYQTGSIWTAVVVHALHNGLTLMFSLLSQRG